MEEVTRKDWIDPLSTRAICFCMIGAIAISWKNCATQHLLTQCCLFWRSAPTFPRKESIYIPSAERGEIGQSEHCSR